MCIRDSHPSDNHNSGLLYPLLFINSNHSLFDTKSILSSKGKISTEFEGEANEHEDNTISYAGELELEQAYVN